MLGRKAKRPIENDVGIQKSALEALEVACEELVHDEFYLWPRTPIDAFQVKVVERVGVSDYELQDLRSRPALINRQLAELRKKGLLGKAFSVLDIACGDGLVLWQISRNLHGAHCFGIDLNKGKIDTHAFVQREGVGLYNVSIQHLFASQMEHPFDVVLMLNTYRGWESADLRPHEKNLPTLADEWFARNSRFTILTATTSQISRLRARGFHVAEMGKGEDNSVMVCLSLGKAPYSILNGTKVAKQA